MRYSALVALASLCVLSAPALGQGYGSSCCQSLTPTVQYGTITGRAGEGRDRREWLRAVVLWRGAGEIGGAYGRDSAALVERASRTARFASEEAGRSYFGGFYANGHQYAEHDGGSRLWVLGREFPIPPRDSTLVVMVDRADGVGGPTVIAGHAYLHAQLPERYWSKFWVSGDTTFHVHARDTEGLLLEVLRSSPVVSAFISDAGRR